MRSSRTMAAVLAATLVLAGGGGVALAGGNPPIPSDQEKGLGGPPVEAVITITEDANCNIVTVVAGSCQKLPVAYSRSTNNGCQYPVFNENGDIVGYKFFAELSDDDILGERVYGVGPEGCWSDFGQEDVEVTHVTKFVNTGDTIGAELLLSPITYFNQ